MRVQRSVNSDSGSEVARIRQGEQPSCRGWVEHGQGVDVGAGQDVSGTGFDLGDPQRGAVRGLEELEVVCEVLGLARVPGVVVVGVGDGVAVDEGAVQDQEVHVLPLALLEGLVQVGDLVG